MWLQCVIKDEYPHLPEKVIKMLSLHIGVMLCIHVLPPKQQIKHRSKYENPADL